MYYSVISLICGCKGKFFTDSNHTFSGLFFQIFTFSFLINLKYMF